MEPCTIGDERIGKMRTPCAAQIVESGIIGVIYGMLDPNPVVKGSFELFIQSHDYNIEIERFPPHMIKEIRRINRLYLDMWGMEKLKFDYDTKQG
jgi:pyrimidine deaminase RibD-like protein